MGTVSAVTESHTILVTCEHGGNDVPWEFAEAFARRDAKGWLQSHRGYDPGSLAAAQQLADAMMADLVPSTTTRLLVDLNRSLDNPTLFSKFSRDLTEEQRQLVLSRYYHPYREQVRSAIEAIQDRGQTAIHLSIHTFTPRISGVWRPIDIGFLFDPARAGEAGFCQRWRKALLAMSPKRRVLMNEPYAGTADGLTTSLRQQFDADRYYGIEIEINNRFSKRSAEAQRGIVTELIESYRSN